MTTTQIFRISWCANIFAYPEADTECETTLIEITEHEWLLFPGVAPCRPLVIPSEVYLTPLVERHGCSCPFPLYNAEKEDQLTGECPSLILWAAGQGY